MASIIVALEAYGFPEQAQSLRAQWETAPTVDPTEDGPEIAILSVEP